jgi:hypothetical protein
MNSLDLNTFLHSKNYSVDISPPESEADANLRRAKDRGIFWISAIVGLTMFSALMVWLFLGTPSAEDRKWIFALLGSAFTWAVSNLKR